MAEFTMVFLCGTFPLLPRLFHYFRNKNLHPEADLKRDISRPFYQPLSKGKALCETNIGLPTSTRSGSLHDSQEQDYNSEHAIRLKHQSIKSEQQGAQKQQSVMRADNMLSSDTSWYADYESLASVQSSSDKGNLGG